MASLTRHIRDTGYVIQVKHIDRAPVAVIGCADSYRRRKKEYLRDSIEKPATWRLHMDLETRHRRKTIAPRTYHRRPPTVSETFDIVMNDAGVRSSLRPGDQSSNRDAMLHVPM
jgi:hypothetical protein